MANIHDNEIISYVVNLKNQEIILHMEYLNKSTDVIFSKVLGHFFENELSGSIMLDITEYSINQFVKDNNELLKQRKNYCWPIDYDYIEQLTEKLQKEQYCYYVISSSYGLGGWILAKNYETIFMN